MLLLATVVLVILIGSWYIWKQQSVDYKKSEENTTISTTIKQQSATKNTSTTAAEEQPSASTAGLPVNPMNTTTDSVSANPELKISITSVLQNNGFVTANVTANGNGTCVFLFQPSDGGKPVTNQVAATNNTCVSSISETQFAFLGLWKLTTTYYNNGNKVETSQDVTIH